MFLGQAAGGFCAAPNYPIGAGATAVAVGDWNHDGRADLAVAERGVSTDGRGGNPARGSATAASVLPMAFPVGLSPVSIDCRRFQRRRRARSRRGEQYGPFACAGNDATCRVDSDCDRQGPCRNSGDLTILMGAGDGTFQLLRRILDARGPKAIAVADFDRDQHDDIALCTRDGPQRRRLLRRRSMGGFTLGPSLAVGRRQPLGGRGPRHQRRRASRICWCRTRSGTRSTMYTSLGATRRFRQDDTPVVSRRPISMAAADFDGDGRYDGAAADNFVAGAVSVSDQHSGAVGDLPAMPAR